MRALSDLQEQQHQRLVSSIEYAATIQNALLADSRQALLGAFPGGHHLTWRPRDLVGGDCFFAAHLPDGFMLGLMDCTGHGVPGALLTSIAISEAGRIAALPKVRRSPATVLSHLSRRMKEALQQRDMRAPSGLLADDGMDAAFIWIDAKDGSLTVSSAKLPIFLIDGKGGIVVRRGDRKGLGYRDTPLDFEWTEQRFEPGMAARLLLATDGLSDQIGARRSIGFGWSGVTRSLSESADASLDDQMRRLWSDFETHRGAESPRDDITILGLDLSRPDER